MSSNAGRVGKFYDRQVMTTRHQLSHYPEPIRFILCAFTLERARSQAFAFLKLESCVVTRVSRLLLSGLQRPNWFHRAPARYALARHLLRLRSWARCSLRT